MPFTMNDQAQAKEYIKSQLESYLRGKGLDTNPSKHFGCPDPAHRDSSPSAHYDRERNKVHCFGCGRSFDTFDLIGIEYGITDQKEIFKKAYEVFGLSPTGSGSPKPPALSFKATAPKPPAAEEQAEQDMRPYFAVCRNHIGETDYLHRRGISPEVAARFGVGYDPAFSVGGGNSWQALIVPTGKDSYVARNTAPDADKGSRYRKTGKSRLFNAEALRAATQPVFVVEGEIDAMAVCTAGGEAVALGSTANRHQFVDQLAKNKPPVQPLILALDADEGGQKCTKTLAAELSEIGILYTIAAPDIYGGCKDAGEAIIENAEGLAAALRNEAEAARQAWDNRAANEAAAEAERTEREKQAYISRTQAAAHLQAFINGIAEAAETEGVSTGFLALDKVLEGGLFEGLYVIGAISALGKTTLAMQMADQIAAAGHDVLIFSLEMSRYELMSKSISRHTAQLVESLENEKRAGKDPKKYRWGHAKTARGITQGSRYANYSETEISLINDAVEAYNAYASRVYIREGVGDIGAAAIREQVERHIEYTGNKPIVLVDYLQILAPADVRATDKQNTDKAVVELKRLSRDLKTPVIAISSFNRGSYRESVAMEAFKESGAIEYTSDVLIGLQFAGTGGKDFDIDQARAMDPREIEAVILKNRYGRSGLKLAFSYYPKFNLFIETTMQSEV